MPIQFDPFVASQGLAAGLAGKLPEFQQTQNQKAQLDLEKKKQDDEMQVKIQESQFKDAYAAQQLLSSEDYDGIVKLGITRLTMLKGLNANPAETQRVLQLAIAARNGDPDARRLLKGELDSAVKVGQATGVLKVPEPTSYKSEVDALGVRKYTEGPDIGKPVPGFETSKPETKSEQTSFEKTRQIQLRLEQDLAANPNDPKLKEQLDLNAAYLATLTSRPDSGDKVPMGYRVDPKDPNKLIPIPGGPADTTATISGRNLTFFNRILISANQATEDLKNISELPISASSGFFSGVLKGAGTTSLYDATKKVLANKVTKEDTQFYNVLSTGLQRSLAAIETSGLAASGALVNQMESIILKEGDTQLTKLIKLAQTRQIVELGMEATLTQPGLTEAQIKNVNELLSSLEESIPYSPYDIIKFSEQSENNPSLTFSEYMKSLKKQPAGSVPTPTAAATPPATPTAAPPTRPNAASFDSGAQ